MPMKRNGICETTTRPIYTGRLWQFRIVILVRFIVSKLPDYDYVLFNFKLFSWKQLNFIVIITKTILHACMHIFIFLPLFVRCHIPCKFKFQVIYVYSKVYSYR
jgi:hypothetical protein